MGFRSSEFRVMGFWVSFCGSDYGLRVSSAVFCAILRGVASFLSAADAGP